MSGNGLEFLPQPDGRHLKLVTQAIETEEQAWAEALEREKRLSDAWSDLGRKWPSYDMLGDTAYALSERFAASRRSEAPLVSPAHPVWMRDRRLALTGEMLKISKEIGNVDTVATIMPASWCITPSQLHEVDPKQLVQSLYMMIYRCGGDKAKGFLLAVLHGEYDETRSVIWLHMHLWLGGEMVQVLDNLRKSKKLRGPTVKLHGKPKKRRAIRIRRRNLVKLPAPYTYILQSFWPSRMFFDARSAEPKRGRRSRIKEPVHTDVLLWLDRWKLSDISFMMGLKATRNGLTLTRGCKRTFARSTADS